MQNTNKITIIGLLQKAPVFEPDDDDTSKVKFADLLIETILKFPGDTSYSQAFSVRFFKDWALKIKKAGIGVRDIVVIEGQLGHITQTENGSYTLQVYGDFIKKLFTVPDSYSHPSNSGTIPLIKSNSTISGSSITSNSPEDDKDQPELPEEEPPL